MVNPQRMKVICFEAPPDVLYAVREKPPWKTMQFIKTLLLTLVPFGAATLAAANAAPGMPSPTERGFATNSSNYREWPAELPLPRLSASADWTKTASIIQPWESTEFMAVKDADQWAPRLVNKFGFEAVILLPPALRRPRASS